MPLEKVRIPRGASTMGGIWRYRELQAHGKVFEVYTYPGADHGWTNVNPTYRKEAADDCWRRSIAFLRRHASNRTQIAAAGSWANRGRIPDRR